MKKQAGQAARGDMKPHHDRHWAGKMQKLLRDLKITQIIVGGQMLRLTELARYYFGTETI